MTTASLTKRSVELGEYRFLETEDEHTHQIFKDGEWKNLYGISTVTKDITSFSIAAYYGSRRALMALGFDPKVDMKAQGETERQNEEAAKSLIEISKLTFKEWKKKLTDAYKAHATYSKSRADKGTNSHDIIDKWIKKCIAENNGYPMESDEAVVKKFIELTKHREPRFIASENHGYNKELWVGGITDIIVETNMGIGIWDNKDRPAIYEKDILQFGGYTLLKYPKFPDLKFTHVLGIPLEGDEVREFYNIPQLQQAFKGQLEVFKFMESIKPKY